MIKSILEIGVEELPSSEYENIIQQLYTYTEEELKNRNISYSKLQVFIAPRRFGISLEGLPEKEPDRTIERKGPAKKVSFDENGNPTKPYQGFLRSLQNEKYEIEEKEFKGNTYIFAKIKKEGKKISESLAEIYPKIIKKLKFKKPMRWGNGKHEFIRPVHWILALLDYEIIDFEIFGINSSRKTYGHRFLGKGEISITHPDKYFDNLRENFVIADYNERKERIIKELETVSTNNELEIEKDEELINEITQLTEYPGAVVGKFNEEYLTLPEEVIKITVKHHQRSFVAKKENKITNYYIAFQDGLAEEKNVINGYSRVINARLDDAKFYYEEDLNTPQDTYLSKLNEITYQAGLGTYLDKVKALKEIAKLIAERLNYKNENLLTAAELSKIDIPSHIVYEFTELQGTMGRIYLKHHNFPEDIYIVPEEHYKPVEESDDLPTELNSLIISLADKLFDIVGFFGIKKIPTGSKDPFALRRKAYGVLRIIIENNWDIDLNEIMKEIAKIINVEYLEKEIADFFKGRFETYLSKKDITTDVINTVTVNWNKPLRALLSAQALNNVVNSEDFKVFIKTFQRVQNISRKHNSLKYDGRLFKEDAEKVLFDAYLTTKGKLEEKIEHLNYDEAIDELLKLRNNIDNYFDNVFVMDKDESIRMNRLGFLKNVANLFLEFGDIEKLYS
ncbi:glycyl-tRNA synthetase beta chain [Marinitoga hydrogenitolerans DSM 16785]|uniref:Glycine--tRNA ligase beta subunit n=1 Tax=Marinitoga hydrogenitolerans (strain DSM 16785 / JCM 12826 / AT1271) TaxID=1122195 RepID=A0A1M4YYA6_MARH1|nr:glycine--tRNA ligase subunit beta [Marinitoga hydrogenitolerans]SHF10678.1 glycyl-tRNA synthetase beta chain [Marinitoga hydrogenitolerans DSM 16785]